MTATNSAHHVPGIFGDCSIVPDHAAILLPALVERGAFDVIDMLGLGDAS